MSTPEFWRWIATRKAHDNPRGDFIRDTRDLMNMGIDPETCLHRLSGNPEGEKAFQGLLRAYERKKRQERFTSALDAITELNES